MYRILHRTLPEAGRAESDEAKEQNEKHDYTAGPVRREHVNSRAGARRSNDACHTRDERDPPPRTPHIKRTGNNSHQQRDHPQ